MCASGHWIFVEIQLGSENAGDEVVSTEPAHGLLIRENRHKEEVGPEARPPDGRAGRPSEASRFFNRNGRRSRKVHRKLPILATCDRQHAAAGREPDRATDAIWDSCLMPDGVVGRERELESAGAFLRELEGGSAALVIEGEAGIGKTALWLEIIGAAEARGFRVLQAGSVQGEVGLSYAALTDLVGASFDAVRGMLPEPQARALAVALLRDDSAVADARATAVGWSASWPCSSVTARRLSPSMMCSGSMPHRSGRFVLQHGACLSGSGC